MDPGPLRQLLVERKIATMSELKAVLGTEVDMTVFRRLRKLNYRSSYSHRGKYTSDETAEFDDLCLRVVSVRQVLALKVPLRTVPALAPPERVGYGRGIAKLDFNAMTDQQLVRIETDEHPYGAAFRRSTASLTSVRPGLNWDGDSPSLEMSRVGLFGIAAYQLVGSILGGGPEIFDCHNCGEWTVAVRRRRTGDHHYCDKEECRRAGNAERKRRSRARHHRHDPEGTE